jgi:hypothetical protein
MHTSFRSEIPCTLPSDQNQLAGKLTWKYDRDLRDGGWQQESCVADDLTVAMVRHHSSYLALSKTTYTQCIWFLACGLPPWTVQVHKSIASPLYQSMKFDHLFFSFFSSMFVWLVAGAGLFWEKSTADWLCWWMICYERKVLLAGGW